MAAVWLRFRAELRRRWRAWIGLAVLLGVAAGVVAAVAVGARRTSTVVDRFHRELAGYDAYVENYPDPGVPGIDPAQIEALPLVTSSVRVRLDYLGRDGDTVVLTGPDAGFGTRLEHAKVLAGRLPNPRRADEVTIATGSQEDLGASVGDEVPLVDPEQIDESLRPLLRSETVRIVGVVAAPNTVALARGAAPGGNIFGTPALHDEIKTISDAMSERHPEFGPKQLDGVMVQLKRGNADFPAFQEELKRLAKGGDVSVQSAPVNTVNLRRSMQLQSITLSMLAGLLGIVGLASIISAIRQSANVDIADASTFRAVGLTRVDLSVLAVLRGVFIGVVGAALALTIAIGLSSRVLFGLARDIEPSLGISVDWTVLGATVAFVLVLAVVVTMIGGVLARRASLERPHAPALRVPPATSIPTGVGVRFACSGWSLLGRGIAGPALGIAALAGALVFGASLTHLRADPSLYGWRWDVVASNYGGSPDSLDPGTDKGMAVVRDVPKVEAAAVGNSLDARIGDEGVYVVTIDVVRGSPSDVLPPIAEGEAPVGPGEIALASRTMHRLGAGIGDHLELSVEDAPRAMPVTVVGRVVMPPVLGTVEPGEGALMPNRSTFDALGIKTGGELVAAQNVYLRVAPGAEPVAVIADLNKTLGGSSPQLYEVPRVQPARHRRLRPRGRLPVVARRSAGVARGIDVGARTGVLRAVAAS